MQAIIFDIDGTLLRSSDDDERIYRRAVETVLGKVSFRNNLQEYEHVSDTGILTQIFSDNRLPPEQAMFDAVKRTFFSGIERHLAAHGPFPQMPGAEDFLERIHASSEHVCAIATGGWRESARMKLQAAGLPIENVPLATSDDAVDRTDIMQIALESLGAAFDMVTYYGDGPWDRSASERLGWSFVAVGDSIDGISSFHEQRLSVRS